MREFTLHTGDSLDVLKTMAENSIDSVITDPPYELGFMNKGWDKSGVANNVDFWKEVYRVLKPGGHLLSFGGARTFHRMTCAVEDAGFEIRDCLSWLYGSGFPKSMDVSKAIDKYLKVAPESPNKGKWNPGSQGSGPTHNNGYGDTEEFDFEPVSQEAKDWKGWGTALKPAWEPIILARKPLRNTVSESVLQWGTGALNIEGTRVSTEDNLNGGSYGKTSRDTDQYFNGKKPGGAGEFIQPSGRWPANIILDEEAAKILDEQSGVSKSRPRTKSKEHHEGTVTTFARGSETSPHRDSGGASRFFYIAKTSTAEREEGLEELETRDFDVGDERPSGGSWERRTGKKPALRANHHPTVKPITLMRYLIRLVTPPDGTVLDPFCGSGSTGCATMLEDFNFIGIDLDPEYIEISRARIEHWKTKFDKAK